MYWPLEALVFSLEEDVRHTLNGLLTNIGLDAVFCPSLSEMQEILSARPICIVFCDYRLADANFRSVLKEVEGAAPYLPVIVTSRIGSWNEYLEVLKSGAFDYLDCSCTRHEFERAVERALNSVSLYQGGEPDDGMRATDLGGIHASAGIGSVVGRR